MSEKVQIHFQKPPGRQSNWADDSTDEENSPEVQQPSPESPESPEFWPNALPELEPEALVLAETEDAATMIKSPDAVCECSQARDEILALLRKFGVTAKKIRGVYNQDHDLCALCSARVPVQLDQGDVDPKDAGDRDLKDADRRASKGTSRTPHRGKKELQSNTGVELRLADVLPPPSPNCLRRLSKRTNTTSSHASCSPGVCTVIPLGLCCSYNCGVVHVPTGTAVMGQLFYNA
eukprot:TRINITY_DN83385_c0_g1_i1.p1 TRINITY_DN83385_c0_g1~~TRINITY_DN83385_c0_g1_i1.p1  ORF type:complete len:235 (+),score=42.77 TRINITY_DN83385_c0_g1_i1:50-754(+)